MLDISVNSIISTQFLIYLSVFFLMLYGLMYFGTFLAKDSNLGGIGLWSFKSLEFKRALIVIAHPDDECMFFGPTLLNLLASGRRSYVYVLSLSSGGYEGKQIQRKQEFWDSCRSLGVRSSNIMLLNCDKMKDDPNREWPSSLIRDAILSYIKSYDIDTLITFDKYGVSGHKNHCAIYETIVELVNQSLWPQTCSVYTLESINIFRKYVLSILDLWYLYFSSNVIFLVGPKQRKQVQTAMSKHHSQLTWYRRMYVIFSRYMYINSLNKLTTKC